MKRPDFELVKGSNKIFVEAVTSNPSFSKEVDDKLEVIRNIKEEEFKEFIYQLRNESTIKLAGALFNKLRLEYWKLEWVKGNLLILAIEPFHHSLAQWLSDSNLVGYLYGIEHDWHHDNKGELHINTYNVKEHNAQTKSIPSNFFGLPNSENISAVIFSNSATIAKFNRIGKLKGYGDNRIRMIRYGNKYDHNPNAAEPQKFHYVVGETGPIENWAQGISMYHNPHAKYPIDRGLFPGFLHGFFDKSFYSYFPDFFPVQSETMIFAPQGVSSIQG